MAMSDTILRDKQNFQPSNEVLRKWLETRKVDFFSLANRRVMPFFSDVGVKEDKFWFMLAMAVELAGLTATIYGGLRVGGKIALIAILIVFGLVILDLVVAKLIHKNEGELVLLRAEAEKVGFSEPSKKHALQAILDAKIKKDRIWKIFWLVILIIMALVKLGAIFLLGTFNEPVVYYIFFALYMVVVYVHYKHTGYYLAYSGLLGIVKGVTNLMSKEYKIFAEAEAQGKTEITEKFKPEQPSQVFRTSEPLNNIPIKHKSGHVIDAFKANNTKEDSNLIGEGENKYTFTAHGVLTDQEIIEMTNGQEKENVINIFMAGRTIQLEKYNVGTSNQNA